jgi:SRSO17 transposase
MAAELTPDDYDQLHNFMASPAWQTTPLEEVLAAKADALVGGAEAVLVIDDTAVPKKGTHSVGVASQYAGVLGKTANGQVLVSLTLARWEVPGPVSLRLFLPDAWTGDPERCRRAGGPEMWMTPRTKPEMALEELDRLRALGVRFGEVVADAGYGRSAAFCFAALRVAGG